QVTNISNNPNDDFTPSWSPDGSRIAYFRAAGPGPIPQQDYKDVIIATVGPAGAIEVVLDPFRKSGLPSTSVLDAAQLTCAPDGTEMAAVVFDSTASGVGDTKVLVFDTTTGATIGTLDSEGNVGVLTWQRVAR